MPPYSTFAAFFLLLNCMYYLPTDAIPEVFAGYEENQPAEPYKALYKNYFTNLNSIAPCIATANMQQPSSSDSMIKGCLTPNSAAEYLLWPVTIAESKSFSQFCFQNKKEMQANQGQENFVIHNGIMDVIPRHQGHMALVLAPDIDLANKTASENLKPYNISCFLELVTDYQQSGGHHVTGTWIDSVILPAAGGGTAQSLLSFINFAHMANPSSVSRFSPYYESSTSPPHAWVKRPKGINAMQQGFNLTILALPSLQDFHSVREKAYLNRQRIVPDEALVSGAAAKASVSALYPRAVLESNLGMTILQTPFSSQPKPQDPLLPSCLTQSPPTCLPIGGQSVWGTTAKSLPISDSIGALPTSQNPRNKTLSAQNNIAIIVSSSSTSLWHNLVPGADAAASAVTALMLIVEAVSTSILENFFRKNSAAPQLFFFFFTGEDFGLSGSGRWVKDLRSFYCQDFPAKNSTPFACKFPIFQTANFSGLGSDLSSFQHFIHLEQLATRSSSGKNKPVFFQHVDEDIYQNSKTQRDISTYFEGEEIVMQATTAGRQLPPSSLYSFLKNNSWKYSQSFTTISAYDTEYTNSRWQTPDDIASPEYVNVQQIIDASQKICNVLSSLLNVPVSSPKPTVDANLAATLWHCFAEDLTCKYFQENYGFNVPAAQGKPPNYYPGVFWFYSSISWQQNMIKFFLMDKLQDKNNNGKNNSVSCPCASHYETCFQQKCILSYSFLHHSFSPSLVFTKGKDPVYFTQDRDYFAWTPKTKEEWESGTGEIYIESNWGRGLGARLAFQDSELHAGLILLSSFLTCFLGVGIYYFLAKFVSEKLKTM